MRADGRSGPGCAFSASGSNASIEPQPPRFKPAELHIGDQLSLLVELVDQRTRPLPRADWLVADREAASPGLAEPVAWPNGAKRLVIAPFSNSRVRNWGLDKYSRLAARLLESEDCAIVLVGSPEQREQLAEIVSAHGGGGRIVNLAGRADWMQSAAVIRQADLVIANNSGIAHLAAACGTPVLAIYSGSHQPREWGPRGTRVRAVMAAVPCSPCGYDKLELCPNDHLCMSLITPEAIAAEALSMLAVSSSREP